MSVDETDCCAPTGCCSGCCCKTCCCANMPHGKFVLFPALTLTLASILSMITLCNCKFVILDDVSPSQYYESAGFWPYCLRYNSNYDWNARRMKDQPVVAEVEWIASDSYNRFEYYMHENDDMRKVAMSFGLFATIAGVGAMSGLWPITCKPYGPAGKWIVFTLVVIVSLSQLTTLTMLGTEFCSFNGSCTLGWGGVMSVVAAGLWLIGAIGIAMIPKQRPKPTREEEIREIQTAIRGGEGLSPLPAGTVTNTETIMPDGTRIIEKVTTHSDGTKTVEKTIERPEESVVKAEAVRVVEQVEGP